MYGWIGNMIRVNLSDKTIKLEKLDNDDLKNYIGARGLGTRLYTKEVDPKIDPLSSENKMIFVTGPLTGTLAGSGGRFNVVTKGP